MGLSEFINKNSGFWKNSENQDCNKRLLIEEMGTPFLVHGLALHSVLLNKAQGYQPVWIPNESVPLDLLKSYVPSAEHAILYNLNFWERTKVFFSAVVAYIKVLIKRDILSFTYDGIKYGDLVYDAYLERKKVGSIKYIDLLVLSYIKKYIRRHVIVTKTLKLNNISAVLVSHRIGLISASLIRIGLKHGYEVYSETGVHRATLMRTTDISEMIKYEFTPTKDDLDKLLSLSQEKFDKLYNFVRDFHVYGNSSADAKYAFSEDNHFYKDKESFAKGHNLDVNKKNIFVMLHAFTDFPHSHFKWMVFKDYADWFLQTLKFAKKDKNVNWIFKRHPSDKFYPTKDINFTKLFKNVPDNVIFLDNDDRLDTRSLINISDAIVTCLGSAGFEIPAMAGVPSVTAADNHYQGFGFSMNPETKKDYYRVLSNLKDIRKLTFEQQKIAKAVYMFVHYFSSVNFSAMPFLSLDDHHRPNMDDWFWDKVIELYDTRSEVIKKEMDNYVAEIAKDDFKNLRSTVCDLEKAGVI